MLLAHPEAEDLGRFVEGTLDDPQRAAIVDHIADCDDCRMTIVDAAEFTEPAIETQKWGAARWLAIAAAAVFVVTLGTFSHHEYRESSAGRTIDLVQDAPRFVTDNVQASIRFWRSMFGSLGFASPFTDPLADVEEAYGKVSNRPLEARISGFPYVPRHNMRGAAEDDIQLDIMKGKAADLMELQGTDAKTLNSKGIGFLLGDDPKKSIALLQSAADHDPNNAKYQSDLAAALIAAGSGNPPMLEHALAACDRAIRIDPRSPDALFNRAVALQALDRPDEAIAAYDHYLAVDSSSPWAGEVRRYRDALRPLP
jgi:tetratricopeptide (TPR) repeat protein